jgi:hypothetical protein
MKSLIFSHQAEAKLSESLLSFQERDALIEQLHLQFEFISRTVCQKHNQFPLKIDSLSLVLDMEVCPEAIVIVQIQVLDECC